MNVAKFKQDLVDAIPRLRAFARSISGDRDRADDLVQETLAKAIANKDKFTEGTNLTAWLITILRKLKTRKGLKNFNNPWCAFQSVFAEPPFDVFDMQVGQVAMLYHTVKDHLVRHVDALSARPTGSLWDYVPEPRLHSPQPLINDAQSPNVNVVDPADELCKLVV